MSYLVLARKFRPRLFSEVVGQKPIVRTLQNALLQERVAHALIFSGVRGTGKTTLARIMAKALNCENRNGAEPCNTCTSCLQIAEGSSIDLQEVDGASNRGIQEIRELKDKIRFMPTSSRYKIIIIDEVHMLTTEAFNALLKTLEEPPEHVFFMFATTELHKVPLTILSRCQRYELKRISRKDLTRHFTSLAQQEQVQIQPVALEMVVREAEGSVRDGLSLLDQIFSYCGQDVKVEDVVEVLGLVNNQTVADLADALLQRDLSAVYVLLEDIYNQGMDFKRLSNELLSWFRNLVICKINPGEGFFDLPEDDMLRMQQSVTGQSLETLTAIFNLLLEGLEKAHFSAYSRLALELTFIKIFQIGSVVPVGELITRFDNLLSDVPESVIDQFSQITAPAAPVASAKQVQPVASTPVPSKTESLSATVASVELQEQDKSQVAPASTAVPQPSVAPTPPDIAQAVPMKNNGVDDVQQPQIKDTARPVVKQVETKKDIRRDWDGFIAYVRERQPWMAASLQRASSVKQVGEELVVQFEDSIECSLLRQKKYIQSLTEFFLDFFQKNLTIRFDVPEGQDCEITAENGQKPHLERRALANDPLVLTAVEIFNGQVGDIRIGPRFRKKNEQEQTPETTTPAETPTQE